MPKSITGNTPAPQSTLSQFKPDLIDRLESQLYDTLTLERERLTQLSKLIDTAIADLHRYPEYPTHAIEQAGVTLGIAQYLLSDFHYQTDSEIKALEGNA